MYADQHNDVVPCLEAAQVQSAVVLPVTSPLFQEQLQDRVVMPSKQEQKQGHQNSNA